MFRIVRATVVEENSRAVDTGLYLMKYLYRTYRYECKDDVYICKSCLCVNRYFWYAATILSLAVVIISFPMPLHLLVQTKVYEHLVFYALSILGAFGSTYLLLFSLSRMTGFIGQGLENDLAMAILRNDVVKHRTNGERTIAHFTLSGWEAIRDSGSTRVDPEDDFRLSLVLLGALTIPFTISIVFEKIGLRSFSLLWQV